MPRGDNIPPSMSLLKALILGDPKAGKSDWALKAAQAGFNVLYLDGDVGIQTIAEQTQAAKSRIYYMDVADDMLGDSFDPKMIAHISDFMTSTTMLWNDTHQRPYSAKSDANPEGSADEIWEIKPARLDHTWVVVMDSWTTLSYSAMLAKAQDMGVEIADMEKIDRAIYSGVGNRLTNMLATIQKMPCHVVVIGHPAEYAKTRNPDKEILKGVKELDKITEWTRMIPKSSSNPHGLTMGKFFSDIGWIDVDKWGKRKLSFKLTNERVSGGHLDGPPGDPRESHSFANLVKSVGGVIPDGTQGTGPGLTIHEPGTFIPASRAVPQLGLMAGKSTASSTATTQVKGLGGLANLRKS